MTDAGGATAWRIDELAGRAGLPVGTVRLYQRDGLLQPGRRVGRSMTYGVAHLDRLVRIQRLREANFTLTAIRRMLDEGQFVLLDRVLGTDQRPRTRQQLVEETGLDAELVEELESLGFLAPPAERGADHYDGGEAGVLQAVAQLIAMGTPPAVLSAVLPLYLRHVRALERDLLTTLSGRSDLEPGLPAGAVASYSRRAAEHSELFLHRWDVVVDYLHHRMIERLVQRARSSSSPPAPGGAGTDNGGGPVDRAVHLPAVPAGGA